MRVRITLDVEVNPEQWELIYGNDPRADRAEDVRQYVAQQIAASSAADGSAIVRVGLR